MRILICNNSFPGQFEALAKYLTAENEVAFASSYERRDYAIPKVRRIVLRKSRDYASKSNNWFIQQWARVINEGRDAYKAFMLAKEMQFEPDIVLFSASCGEGLFIKEAFPRSFKASYLNNLSTDIYTGEADNRAVNMIVQGMSILRSDAIFAFAGAEKQIPECLQTSLHLIPASVDTQFFNGERSEFISEGVNFSDKKELVTIAIDNRDLNKATESLIKQLLKRKGIHILLTYNRPNLRTLVEDAFASLLKDYPDQLSLRGLLTRTDYRAMLTSSTICIFPSVVNSIEKLLEGMCSKTIVLARMPRDDKGVLRDGETMFKWPERVEEQTRLINRILDAGSQMDAIRQNARKAAMEKYEQKESLAWHYNELLELYGKWKINRLNCN